MILFLAFLIGAGINLSGCQEVEVQSAPSSSCLIATNVKSALHILGDEFDYFEKDESVLVQRLRDQLSGEIPYYESQINNADADKLYNYASMFGMIQAGKLNSLADGYGVLQKDDWLHIDIDSWRFAFEEVALAEMDADGKNYLSTFFAEYTDLEVLVFVCGNYWSPDGRKAPAFNDGCYDAASGDGDLKHSRWECQKFCRGLTEYALYAVYNVDDQDPNYQNCQCLESFSGTYSDATPQTCSNKLVYRTGKGAPITNFEDNVKFDLDKLGVELIDGNDLVDIKQVNLVDSAGESSLHFAALMKFSIALFKVKEDESKDLSYELVDWRRWDAAACGDNTAYDPKCMQEVNPIDSRTKVFPGIRNLKLNEAVAFEIIPMFVEYSVAMELNTTKTSDQFTEFQSDPYIKTGNPQVYPGGKWFDNIYMIHRDDNQVDMSSMLRIEGGMLNQLYQALGSTFFGSFLPETIRSYPVAMDHRIAGRKTFLFVATHRENVADDGQVTNRDSWVSLYSVYETEIEITDFALYGRIRTRLETEVEGFFVTDVLYVKTAIPLLVVMDSANKDLDAQGRPTNTQIRVYKIKSFVELVLTDAVIIDNFKFTKVSHVKLLDEHKLVLEGNINGLYTAKYLELSIKGKFSTELSDVLLPSDVQDPGTGGLLTFFKYGRLKNNLVVPVLSGSNIHFLSSLKGDEVTTFSITPMSSKALSCFEHKEMDVCTLGRVDSDGKINFELTRFTPHSKLKVDDKAILYTMWDSLKFRIEKMYDSITTDLTSYEDRLPNYLMNSGSVIPSDSTWSLASLTASELSLPSGALEGSTVTMKIVNSEMVETSYTDMKSKLNILLDTVEDQANLVETKTTEYQTKYESDALTLTSTDLQTISNTNIEKVTANRVRSTDVHLVVDELKSPVSDAVITLKDLSDKTFMINDPKPVNGKKKFTKGLAANNLDTGTLSDNVETVRPDTCLVKNLDVTINVPQSFANTITTSSLLVEGTASIADTEGNTVVKEDLEPHIDRENGLPGFISFDNDVNAVGLDATIANFHLDANKVPDIALKDQANTIAGDLTFNLPVPASGSSLLLKDNVLLNNIDVLDVKANAVRTSCAGCQDCSANCADTVLQVHSPVTFKGTVSASAATVTELNDISWDNYIKQTDFNNDIKISGAKTFTDITVETLEAETFHGLKPDQLLTTNSQQDIASDMTFAKSTTFKSVITLPSNPCVPVDGTNLCEVFKSDLAAINNKESWISSNTIFTDLKFKNLKILTGSDLQFDGTVNAMNVGDIVDKIVTDESKSFSIIGTKTISSPATLTLVTSGDSDTNVNLVSEGSITTIDDYVNTKTTSEISGEKQFTNEVSIEDIYTVGETLINDLSVAHLLHCFVDKGDHSSDPIHIYHPMTFNKVSLPRMVLERNSDFDSYGIVPKLEDYPTVIQFCNIPLPSDRTLDGADPNDDGYYMAIVNSFLLSNFGVTLTRDSDYFVQAMFTCVLDPPQETLSNPERIEKIKQLLNTRYGFSMTSLNLKTNIELLAIIARNPLVNFHDPSKDLALLDSNNAFCEGTEGCVQEFQGGIDASKITLIGNLQMLDDHTVHGVDLDLLDTQRVKMSSPNTVEGVLSFSSLSLKPTTGQYSSGFLKIATGSNGFVKSRRFARKFVNTGKTSDQTVTGTINFEGQITAGNINAPTFNIDGETYDVSATDGISHDLDEDVAFANLFFNNDIELQNAVSLTGTLSGVTLSEFHDAVAIGEDIPVTVDGTVVTATIQGTNQATLDISGKKTLASDFTVDNVVASKDDMGLYPQFIYPSCKPGNPIVGKLVGNKLVEYSEDNLSLKQCFDKCREGVCHGLSFTGNSESSSSCILYEDITGINVDSTDFTSYIYECCLQILVSSSSPPRFLTVDSSQNLAVSQTGKDLWCFIGEDLLHKKSDKAVIKSGDKLVLAAIPHTSVEGDPSPAYEKFSYVVSTDGSYKFRIQSSAGNYLKANIDHSLSLDTTGSYWEAASVGIAFTELDGEVIKPRVLTVNTVQDVTGSFIVRGDLTVENTEIHAENLDDLTYDAVTATYSYNAETSTHQIATDYTLTGSGITVTNLDSPSYNIDDFVRLDTTIEVELKGNTQFTDDVTTMHADGISVLGTVASYDLNDFDTNVARTHATELTFTEANSFVTNTNDGQTYDLEGNSLSSSVDMDLTTSQISGFGKIDLDELRSKSILNDETSPVTINGKVIFNKVVINGGDFTMVDSKLAGYDIGIVDDLILKSDTTVDFSNHPIDSMIINQPLTISGGNLFGHSSDKFLDVLYKNGDQTVTEGFTMNGAVTTGDVTTTTFNGYDPPTSMIKLEATTAIDSNFDFKNALSLNNVAVTGNVNDFDFIAKFKDSVATLAGDNSITEKWTIQPAHFDGDIDGTAGTTTKDQYINDQRVYDLNKAAGIVDHIHAVKTSAQAEANVLCEFVSSLQDTYMANQDIVHYQLVSTDKFEGASFSSSKLVNSKDGSKNFLFVLNGRDVELYYAGTGTILKKFYITLAIANAEGFLPRIDHVLDVSDSTTEFKYIVFVSTGKPSSGVEMYLATINTAVSNVNMVMIGTLSNAVAVTEMCPSSVLVYRQDAGNVVLDVITVADLTTCAANNDCSSITVAKYLDACNSESPELCKVESVTEAVQVNVKARTLPTKHKLIVFNQNIPSLDQNVLRVLLFEKSVQGAYTLSKSIIESTDTLDFSISILDAKTFLLLSGSRLEMRELDVSSGTLEDKDLSKMDRGTYTYINDGMNYGSENGILVVKNGNKFVDLKYNGVDGLMTYSTLDIKHSILSVSCSDVVDATTGFVVHIKAFINKDTISMLKVDLANPVKYVQFECAQPEVPVGFGQVGKK